MTFYEGHVMPIIECDDCGREVSSRAASCPKCGAPISTVTIQQTAKKWKAVQAIGGLGLVLSSGGVIAGAYGPPNLWQLMLPSVVFAMLFLVLFIVGHVGAWWEHG